MMWPFSKKPAPIVPVLLDPPFEIGEMVVVQPPDEDLEGAVYARPDEWVPMLGLIFTVAALRPANSDTHRRYWGVRLKEDPDQINSWWDERCFRRLDRKTDESFVERLQSLPLDVLIGEDA